jgi:heme O synthase-like polyprenyltransferase
MPVFIPAILSLIFLLLAIKEYREDEENEEKERKKIFFKELFKTLILLICAIFIWLVFY